MRDTITHLTTAATGRRKRIWQGYLAQKNGKEATNKHVSFKHNGQIRGVMGLSTSNVELHFQFYFLSQIVKSKKLRHFPKFHLGGLSITQVAGRLSLTKSHLKQITKMSCLVIFDSRSVDVYMSALDFLPVRFSNQSGQDT